MLKINNIAINFFDIYFPTLPASPTFEKEATLKPTCVTIITFRSPLVGFFDDFICFYLPILSDNYKVKLSIHFILPSILQVVTQPFAPPAQNFVIRPTCFKKFFFFFTSNISNNYLSFYIKNRKFDIFTIPSADTKLWPSNFVDDFLSALVGYRETGASAVAIILLLDRVRFTVIEKSYNKEFIVSHYFWLKSFVSFILLERFARFDTWMPHTLTQLQQQGCKAQADCFLKR